MYNNNQVGLQVQHISLFLELAQIEPSVHMNTPKPRNSRIFL